MSVVSVATPVVSHQSIDASKLAESISIRDLSFYYGNARR